MALDATPGPHSADVIALRPQSRKGRPTKTRAERFWSHVDKRGADDCWPYLGSTAKNGYGQFNDISPVTGKRTTRRAHRVAFELHNGSIPDGKGVLHTAGCTTKRCCNPAHLYAGTQKQNVADAKRDGRLNGSLLTPANVKTIVLLMTKGYGSAAMQERFGISAQAVSNIMGGRTWGHVTGIKRTPDRKGGRPGAAKRAEIAAIRASDPVFKFPQSELFDVLDEAFNWKFAEPFVGKAAVDRMNAELRQYQGAVA
jgi:hypothetical protein